MVMKVDMWNMPALFLLGKVGMPYSPELLACSADWTRDQFVNGLEPTVATYT